MRLRLLLLLRDGGARRGAQEHEGGDERRRCPDEFAREKTYPLHVQALLKDYSCVPAWKALKRQSPKLQVLGHYIAFRLRGQTAFLEGE
ncbi:MAG: hypothetical protein DMF67_19575 [Acidobacteria bacterium]|nr:MAG: hypothetical protein DMF67_19575 [Acidobacteriota bacterium]